MSNKKKNAYKDFAKMTVEFGKNWNTIKKIPKRKVSYIKNY